MRKLKNANNLDRANCAADNISPGEKTMRNSSTKTPWHLRFGEKLKTAAAAIVVGIALLAGYNAEVHGQGSECDPPIFDVCFHKSDWTTHGPATMFVEFNPPPAEEGQLYEIVWRGLRRVFRNRRFVETYENDSQPGQSDSQVASLSYEFYWPSWITVDSYLSYGVEIYEGYWDFENEVNGRPTWVRGDWIGSASLYNHQEAAEISVDASLFPDFDYWKYYCEVDWDSPITPLKYGYILGCWYWGCSSIGLHLHRSSRLPAV